MPLPTTFRVDADPMLSVFWPSERRAILAFSRMLRAELGFSLPLTEVIDRWETAACAWRREKLRRDTARQSIEIARHRRVLIDHLGADVPWDKAAQDWIRRNAASWRNWWEQQPESDVPLDLCQFRP